MVLKRAINNCPVYVFHEIYSLFLSLRSGNLYESNEMSRKKSNRLKKVYDKKFGIGSFL